jgi:hypothetical protein
MAAGRVGRGKNAVRNLDTDLRLIETSQDIYIVHCSENNRQDYRKFKTKAKSKSSKASRSNDCAIQ